MTMGGRSYCVAALSALLLAGCAKPRPAPAPAAQGPAPKQNLFLLLANGDAPSRVTVTNAAGTVELTAPNTAVRVERADAAPGAPFAMDEAAIRKLFGETAAMLPPTERSFTLYFDEASDTLTEESRGRISEILKAIRERPSASVSIAGHTDRTGAASANYELGLKRANRLAEILTKEGLAPESLTVMSHGEGDPVVKTADDVAEPKNRRVEVIVR